MAAVGNPPSSSPPTAAVAMIVPGATARMPATEASASVTASGCSPSGPGSWAWGTP
ncbi:hypothetical protein [Streptomyces europaeiscabiei]|uniref:hypothetical protein n=1 Tax=Streptomyces europaeiscabiei TaxID=146819 RepID=UPI0029A47A82|nr:hypothetical protein [Streptomyces europaeiscabiei]MDX3634029.1 hypothetical protein [Streptomyces europaeiscabiei]MDX3651492.1 hypothetical protein [Streptomyces europaeiscabiei]